MEESNVKANMNDIYDVLGQQKKLEKIRALIINSLEKVNQTINAITVENLQLTHSVIDEELIKSESIEPVKEEPIAPTFNVELSHLVNSQILDIDVKPACYNEEIETDEELDQL